MGIGRKSGVTYENSGDIVVILDEAGSELTSLNAVGSIVWHELDGHRNVEQLAADLLNRFEGVTAEELAVDIELFVGELAEADLVDIDRPEADA